MVRNRMASLANNNARQIAISIAKLGAELRFRVADGFHDRVIFRELFPIGLTALDAIEQGAQKGALTSSQLSARQEIEGLVEALQLPTRTPGLEHIESRRQWHARVSDFYRRPAAAHDFS
jgi:chromosome partitioning protein